MARKDKNDKRLALFRQRIPLYKKDISLFAREQLHFDPDDWQEALFKDVVSHNRITVKSGQGVGKTGCESVIAIWFLSCFPYAKVIATAPTRRQLHDVLWSEIDKWRSKSPVLSQVLKWTKTYIYMIGYEKRWFATARTATKPENMQGFHEDNMMFIVDEASGVPEPIMEAILGTLSGVNNKLLMCGNPTKTSGTFYDSHTADRAIYRCHTVNSENSKRTNKENIAALARKYGRESNVFRVRVLGEFPLQEDDVFIPLSLIEQATMLEPDETVSKISLGVDVARYGDDETVIASKVGGNIALPTIRHGQNLMKTVGDIVILYRKLISENPDYKGSIVCNIDDTGLGGGVTDRLEEVKAEQKLTRLEIVPVNASAAPPKEGSEHYSDITTYMWATVRDLLEARALILPNDNELVAQLSVRKYGIASSGKIVLESKKEMKKRDIDSPDRADAVALACFSRNKIYDSFVDNIQTIIISIEAIKAMRLEHINIGVSVSRGFNKTAFVATGVGRNYGKAIVLESAVVEGSSDTDAVGRAFADFAKRINAKYGALSHVYCDPEEYVLVRSLRNAANNRALNVTVRNAVGQDVGERVLLTNRLIAQNRLFMSGQCDSLTKAFSGATWSDKGKPETRGDTVDDITRNAFEYTVERDGGKYIRNEVR